MKKILLNSVSLSIYIGIYVIVCGIILQVKLVNYGHESGLGGLVPYMLWAIGFGLTVFGISLIAIFKVKTKLRLFVDSAIAIIVTILMFQNGLGSWLI